MSMNRQGEDSHSGTVTLDLRPSRINMNATMQPSPAHLPERGRGDRMDMTPPPPSSMGPPINSSPNGEHPPPNNLVSAQAESGNSSSAGPGPGSGQALGSASTAAAATQQPKVVQTAFIHKLYKYVMP